MYINLYTNKWTLWNVHILSSIVYSCCVIELIWKINQRKTTASVWRLDVVSQYFFFFFSNTLKWLFIFQVFDVVGIDIQNYEKKIDDEKLEKEWKNEKKKKTYNVNKEKSMWSVGYLIRMSFENEIEKLLLDSSTFESFL